MATFKHLNIIDLKVAYGLMFVNEILSKILNDLAKMETSVQSWACREAGI